MSDVVGSAVVEAEISFDQIRRELEPGMRAALAQITKDVQASFLQMERDGKSFAVNTSTQVSRDFQAIGKSAKAASEDTSKALTRAGTESGEGLARGVQSGAQRATQSVQGTGRAAGAAASEIRRAGQAAGAGFASGVEQGAQRGERATQGASQRMTAQARHHGAAAGTTQGASMAAGITSSLSPVIGQLGTVGSRGATMLGTSFKTSLAALGIGASIGAVLSSGFNRLEAIDTAKFKLKALGNDAAKVEEIMKNASAAVTGTAFSMGDAATVAATATSAGIKAGGELERYLKIVAGTAAVTGSGLSEMGSIMNKVQISGKAMTDDLQQIGDRGFDIWGALRDQTGKTIPELQKMASEGQITSTVLQNALEKKVGNAAKVMGGSVRASIDNVKASIGRLGAAMLEPAFKALPSVLDGMMKGFDSLGKGVKTALASEPVQKFLGQIREVGGQMVGQIGPAFTAVKSSLTEAFRSEAFQTFLTKVREIGQSIGQNLIGHLQNLGKIAQDIGVILVSAFKSDIFQGILQGAMVLGGFLGGALLTAWDLLSAGIEKVSSVVAKVTGFFRDHQGVLSTVAVAITAVFVPALISMGVQYAIGTARAVAWIAVLGAQKIAMVASAIAARGLGAAMALVGGPIGLIIGLVAGLVAGLVWFFTKTETGKKVWTAVWGAIKDATKAVVDWFLNSALPVLKSVWDGIASGLRWLWDNVFKPVWDGIKFAVQLAVAFIGAEIEGFKQIWKAIEPVLLWLWHNVIEPVWNGISDAIKAVVSWIKDKAVPWVQEAWRNFTVGLSIIVDKATEVWNGVKEKFTNVVDFVKGLPGKIAEAARGMWDGIKDAFKSMVNGLIDMWNGLASKLSFTVPDIIGMPSRGEKVSPIPTIAKLRTGGIIRGPGTGTSDSILGLSAAGVPTARVSNGESVNTEESTRRNWWMFSQLNAGKTIGDVLGSVLPAFAGGGRVAYGLPAGTNTGGYGSSGSVFPEWVHALESQFGVKASTYAGHQEKDGKNKGIDWTGSVENMQRFAEYALANAGDLEQVIWMNPTTSEKIGVADGQRVGPGTNQPGYYRDDWGGHANHVHTRQSYSWGPGAGADEVGGSSSVESASSGGTSSSSSAGTGSSATGTSSSSTSSSSTGSGSGSGSGQLSLQEEIQRLPLTMLEGALGIKLPWLDPTSKTSTTAVATNAKAIAKAAGQATKDANAVTKAQDAVADKKAAVALAEQKLTEAQNDPKAKESTKLAAQQALDKAQRGLTAAQSQVQQLTTQVQGAASITQQAGTQVRTAAVTTQQAASAGQQTAAVSQSTVQQVAASAGAASGATGADTIPLTQNPDGTWTSSDPEWAKLIKRESGGKADIVQGIQDVNSANGDPASGLFQITGGTWKAHGGDQFAASAKDATPQQQAQVAAKIFGKSGGAPWGSGAGQSGRENEAALRAGIARGGVPANRAAPTIPGSVPQAGAPSGAPQKDTSQVDAGVGQGATAGGGDIFTSALSWGGDAVKEIGGEFLGLFGLDGILGRVVDSGVNAGKAGIATGKKAAEAGIQAAVAGGGAIPGPGGAAAGVAGQAAQAGVAPFANTVNFIGQTPDQVQSAVQRGVGRGMGPVRETYRGNG